MLQRRQNQGRASSSQASCRLAFIITTMAPGKVKSPGGSSSFSCSHHEAGARLNLGSGGYLAAYPVSSSSSSTRQGWLNPRGCWYPIVIITISKAGLGQTPGGPPYLTAVPVGPTHAQQALRLSEQRLREATSTLHFGPDNPSWDCVIKIHF